MTEQTSAPEGTSQTSSSDSIIAAAKEARSASQASSLGATEVSEAPVSSPSASDQGVLLDRLVKLEGEVFPRLQALEEAIESLAKGAYANASREVAKELAELQVAVHSLGGAVIGHTGHDAGAFFHSWWKSLKSEMAAPAPSAASASIPLVK
jgi:hypothetical protein